MPMAEFLFCCRVLKAGTEAERNANKGSGGMVVFPDGSRMRKRY